MRTYYDLMELEHPEAELLVSQLINFKASPEDGLIIHLDEFSARLLSTQYSVLMIWSTTYQENTSLGVLIPGIDDFNFKAWFKPSRDLHLSALIEKMHLWAKRYNYRYLNVHALEYYCNYLGAYDIDWN